MKCFEREDEEEKDEENGDGAGPITPFITIGWGDHLEALSRFCFNSYINFSWHFNCSTNMRQIHDVVWV